MKKKGFTLIELLVVIAIIAMLLAILMPALNKVKKIAQRVVCGTNLKGLGTAHVVYANEYRDSYAIQGKGTRQVLGSSTTDWYNKAKVWSDTQTITVGASLYLLVREADVSPKSFICPSGDQKEFSGKAPTSVNPQPDITDLWDFGAANGTTNWAAGAGDEGPTKTVSYAYHMPYAMGQTGALSTGAKSTYAASGSNTAAFALMADRNPWLDAKLTGRAGATADNYMNAAYLLGSGANPAVTDAMDWSTISPRWTIQLANAYSHSREGQNVLFGDGHSEYTTRSDVGVTNDNIYTSFGAPNPTVTQRRQGAIMNTLTTPPVVTSTYLVSSTPLSVAAKGSDDSVLVND